MLLLLLLLLLLFWLFMFMFRCCFSFSYCFCFCFHSHIAIFVLMSWIPQHYDVCSFCALVLLFCFHLLALSAGDVKRTCPTSDSCCSPASSASLRSKNRPFIPTKCSLCCWCSRWCRAPHASAAALTDKTLLTVHYCSHGQVGNAGTSPLSGDLTDNKQMTTATRWTRSKHTQYTAHSKHTHSTHTTRCRSSCKSF